MAFQAGVKLPKGGRAAVLLGRIIRKELSDRRQCRQWRIISR